jgi:hypothetical protein
MNENGTTEQEKPAEVEASGLDALVMCEYSQGVCHDGAAILRDGQPMTVEEIIGELRKAQKLARLLGFALEGLNGTPHSWGLDITHVRKIQRELAST